MQTANKYPVKHLNIFQITWNKMLYRHTYFGWNLLDGLLPNIYVPYVMNSAIIRSMFVRHFGLWPAYEIMS